jgi:NAD(P)-dependent dehydrogenase (short-subunit alcohol dehydrogenase family)
MNVNINGIFNTCRHALGHMVKRKKGRIINFSSPAWMGHFPNAYTASKGAVVSLTQGLALNMTMEGYDITCNAIVPIADTRMSPKGGAEVWKRWYEMGLVTKQIYVDSSDPGGPEHIPPIVLYLATDEAAGINGQIFGASRGRVALYSWPTEAKGLYKDGVWTLDELMGLMPVTLAQDLRKARG